MSRSGEAIEKITKTTDVKLNEFLALYQKGTFEKIVVSDATTMEWYTNIGTGDAIPSMTLGSKVSVTNYTVSKTSKPLDSSLEDMGISLTWSTIIDIKYTEQSFLGWLFSDILPFLIILAVFALFMRFGPSKWWLGGMMPFSMNVGKLAWANKKDKKVTFADVIGMEEVKQELTEIVDFLKNADKYHKLNARPPKWVLLYGQPWVGKTLLAKAVAGEAGVPFLYAAGSEFMAMLVGAWWEKVRTLFEKAKWFGKAIIFIDEIDMFGKRRGGGTGGHSWWQEEILNQILTEMDGFDTNTNIIVLAATNRPDTLDPALLRSGRFDRKVLVNIPSKEERKLIFEFYLSKKKMDKNLNIDSIVNRSSGMAGAEIENIVNEAALKVAREDRKKITNDDLNYAIEKVVMGPERKTKVITEEKRKLVAYHELGHAVTSYYLDYADKLERITIVPRGESLGATWYSPEEDHNLVSKAQFLDKLVSILWWRAAEEVFLGAEHITTGAGNDFERATRIAADMVLTYGMDEELGPICYSKNNDENNSFYRRYSDQTTQIADTKIKALLTHAYSQAKKILSDHKVQVESIVSVLLDKEYLSREEFEELMK